MNATKTQPKVSVIIPVYNRFHLLGPVVESILGQTLPVMEIILIDDGSTEHTPEMVERYIQERPAWRERVRYHYQENKGQSAANNIGIAMARGEWLAFDGNDDLWLPQKLEWQFRALEQYGDDCGVCFTDAWFTNNPHMKMTLFQLSGADRKELIGRADDVNELVKHFDQVWMQTVIAKTDLVRSVGGLDSQLHFHEDQDFLFRLALATRFCYVGMPMVLIDRTPKQQRHVGRARNWDRVEFRLEMLQARYEKNLALCQGRFPDIQNTLRRGLSDVHSGWASWYLERGETAKAREAALRAMQYHLNANNAVKWGLTQVAPALSRAVVFLRDRRRTRRNYGIGW
jgi:glycosyltransferase involved in cell wall biosynthesis